jgi:hypothetical protein
MTTLKTNKCIVSLATKNSRYVDGLARLSNSLRDNASGIDFLGFIHENSVGAPLHVENNYAFKVFAIQKAIDAGYTQILWLDCSVWAVAPVQPLFNIIEEQGYWFEGAGCWLGDWCNEQTLAYYTLNRDEAKALPMVQSGFMGFNVNNNIGYTLWQGLNSALIEGLFHGDWAEHRHDQSCISAILNVCGIEFSHQPEHVQYAGIYDQILNDKIILKCRGI